MIILLFNYNLKDLFWLLFEVENKKKKKELISILRKENKKKINNLI